MLGFKFSKFKRGYVDGHERADVIAYWNQFLHKIKVLEDTHKPLHTASDGYHPYRIGLDSAEKKLVLIFHDEPSFHSNVGNTSGCNEMGKMPLLPKDQGKGLMISDFIDEHNGFLHLSEAEKSFVLILLFHQLPGKFWFLEKIMKATSHLIGL